MHAKSIANRRDEFHTQTVYKYIIAMHYIVNGNHNPALYYDNQI